MEKGGRNWSTNRAVDKWNRPGSHVVSDNTTESFKRRPDRFMDEDERWCYVSVQKLPCVG